MNYQSTLLRAARLLYGCLLLPVLVLGWDRTKALQFLEARQQKWADWKPAQKHGGACISCHTGLPYLAARRALGEKQASAVERDLVQGVKARVLANPPIATLQEVGAEAVLNLLTLSTRRKSEKEPLEEVDQLALKRLWESQLKEGETKGYWTWINAELHPADSEHSNYYGAALSQLALSAYPVGADSGVVQHQNYMKREMEKQPLHHRLARIAFASKKDKDVRAVVLRDLWVAQSSDGGWSTAALGPWSKQEMAPPDSGSNAYATAWAAHTARESGVSCSDKRMKRALDWLEKNQDVETGAWNSVSMNKVYPEGSIQSKFMTDAATGYAVAALVGCKR